MYTGQDIQWGTNIYIYTEATQTHDSISVSLL